MKAYVTALLAAGVLALAMGVSDPAHARHGWGGGWGGGHWHGGWGRHGGWGWRGPRWGWGGWGWRGYGPRVGVYVGPRVYGRRCWSNYYGRWVPCRWLY